jgi:hypothetical protein
MNRIVRLAVSILACLWSATALAQIPTGPPPSNSLAPIGDEQWIRQFVGPPQTLAVAGSDVYVAGLAGTDIVIRKFGSDGVEQWAHQFPSGGKRSLSLRAAADASGVYVEWLVLTSTSFPTTAGFVRRYDSSGNELWTRQIENPFFLSSVAADPSGVYVTGSTIGTLPGQTKAGFVDAFVRKYDALGNELWTHQFGTPPAGIDLAMGIAADGSSVYVVWSETSLSALFGSGEFSGSFVRKYDVAGTEFWTRQFEGPSLEVAIGVASDSGGFTVASAPLFPGGLAALLQGGSSQLISEADVLLRRFDLDGIQLWTADFGTPTIFGGIAANTSGIYLTGTVRGTLPGQTSEGPDAYIRKYDVNGHEAWSRQFGTEGDDSASGVAVTSAGIYVVGSTDGSSFDPANPAGQSGFLASFPLTPPPPPIDFHVEVTPVASSVTLGDSTSATVTVTPVTASTHPVRFRAFGLPSFATASFGPPACAPPCAATMKVSTSTASNPDLPAPGTVTTVNLTVTGYAVFITKKARFTLSISAPPRPLAVSVQGNSVFCQSSFLAAFVATASGGTAPYTFSWSASAGRILGTGSVITWLPPPTPGPVTLRVTVSDSAGATASAEKVLVIYSSPVVSIAGAPATAIGLGTTLRLSASAVNGTPPFQFTWFRFPNTARFSTQEITDVPPLGDMVYRLIVTDANGCTSNGASAVVHVFDYTVSVDPGIQNVGIGRSATYAATVTLVPGSTLFGLPGVSLSVNVGAQDSGIVGSVTPSLVALGPAPSIAIVTITTSRNTPTGVVPISVDGLAGGAARGAALGLRVILEAQLSTFVTDGDGNPLPVGPDGTPTVAAVMHQNGQISATNPGELLTWGRLLNTGLVGITTVKLNDALPINWMPHPPWDPARGAIHVFVGSTPIDSTEIPWNTLSIGVTPGAPDRVAISIDIVAARGAPLAPGESVWVVVKLAYGLVGTIQSPLAFPIQYVNGAGANATAGPGQSGSYESQASLTVVARP